MLPQSERSGGGAQTPLFARPGQETDPIRRPKSATGYGGTGVSSPVSHTHFRSYDLSTPTKMQLAGALSSEGGDSVDGLDRDNGHGKGHENHSTALESLSSLGIVLLLVTPYVMLALAMLLDLNSSLRVAHTTFTGNVTECGTSNQEFTRACVHVVNENFSTLHSAPLLVPLQSSFLNLDVLFTGNLSTAAFPIGDPKPETDQDDDAAATITTTPTTTVTGSGSTVSGDDSLSMAVVEDGSAGDEEEPAVVLIGARLEVPLEDGSGWETLYNGDMRDLSAECDATTGRCLAMRLLSILFDTPGSRRGFSTYRVALTLTGPSASLALADLQCTVHHDRYAYLFIMAAFRAILLAMTLAGSYIWLSFMLRESPRICDWLPEQQQVAFIFPVLLLWQDPVSLALFWLERPKPSVLFAADLMHAAGYQVLLLIWWLIMDGLRCYESMRDSWLRAMGGTQATGAVSLPPPWPPKHHPRGEYFLDFLLPKLAFFLLSFGAVLATCSLRYPELFLSRDMTTAHLGLLRLLYAVLSLSSLGIMLLWYFIFAQAVLATGRALRRQPYMQTRSQQLSYRFFVQQVVLILVCKVAGYVVEAIRLYNLLRQHLRELQVLWRAELALDSIQLPYWVSSFRSTPGELLFISICCYLAAFIFLPAKRWTESDVGGGAYPHACMESELAELERKRRRFFQETSPRPVFCLETACWLMEASWQAYYDPAGQLHKMDTEAYSGRMALENLGLEMEAHISDVDTDTHVVLARGKGSRLVLSFRGTLSSKNMMTDLKMAQQPLPPLSGKKKLSRHPSYSNHGGSASLGSTPVLQATRSNGRGAPPPPTIITTVSGITTREVMRPPSRGPSSASPMHRPSSTGSLPRTAAVQAQKQPQKQLPPAPDAREVGEMVNGSTNPFVEDEEASGSVSVGCRRCLERIPGFRQALPHVHAGFLHAYLSVRAEVLASVKRALDYEYAPIYLTGHSLGGALAQLAAYDLSVNFDLPDPLRVYTFGCPRIGNPAFGLTYNARVPATFRVVVDGDIISAWPKLFGVYKHAGVEVLVDADSGGNLIVNPSVVESALRMRNRTSATNHSLAVYRECMEACFSNTELLEYLLKVSGKDNRTSADEELPEWLVGSRRHDFTI